MTTYVHKMEKEEHYLTLIDWSQNIQVRLYELEWNSGAVNTGGVLGMDSINQVSVFYIV